MRPIKSILIISAMAISFNAMATVKLQPIFSDNMVLQQKSNAKIWGETDAYKIVTITTSWNEQSYEVKADAKGRWLTAISTPTAGGPYSIVISDGKPLTLKNVLIGEVWICSGQSNMEMRIADKVIGYEKEMAESSQYDKIRLLHIENTANPVPQTDVRVHYGSWQTCSGKNISDFSATAFFFGKELFKILNCPIGLIETCWGGTLAEAWTSSEALQDFPDFKAAVEKVKTLPQSLDDRQKIFDSELEAWNGEMAKADRAYSNGKPLWANTDFNDSSWDGLNCPGYIQDQAVPNFSGIFWLRKTIEIPADWAGKDLTMNLSAIDDNDYTYFDGHLLGHTEGCIWGRTYKVPGRLVKQGKAAIAIRLMDTGGKGGIVAGRPVEILKSKDEKIDLSGAWKYKISMSLEETPVMPVNTAADPNFPTFLYNGMINPLINYSIKGAIWYQGEANTGKAEQYKDLLPLMINDWRTKWGYPFPFYIVQLANYQKIQTEPEESDWAELREAQQQTLHLENTGLAVTIDIGEERDIHPKNKPEVGRRLALNALALTYGKDIEYSGPVYENHKIEGHKIRLFFTHVGTGLKTSDNLPVKGFCIAGTDHKFYFADAEIDGNSVIISSEHVAFPIAARYAWANNPVSNLINGEGLPAGPFRTDSWIREPIRYNENK